MNTKKLMIAVVATLAITAFVPALSAQENNGYLNAGREMKIVNSAEQNAKVLEYIFGCIGNACRAIKKAVSSANIPAGYVPGREGAMMRTAEVFQAKNNLTKALEKANLEAAQKNKKENEKKVCARCGEPITAQGQHCAATHSTALCATKEELEESRKAQEKVLDPNLPKCTLCHNPIVEEGQPCEATHYEDPCKAPVVEDNQTKPAAKEPVCTECGRTKSEVAKYGHHHKPPYTFITH